MRLMIAKQCRYPVADWLLQYSTASAGLYPIEVMDIHIA